MAFTLDIPKKEEIKKVVEEQTMVDEETSLVISDASKQKGDEILRTDIDNFQDRKELTKAIEEFGADAINQIFWAINLSSGAQKYIGEQIGKSGSSGGTTKKYDAGDMVQGYTFGNNAYNLKLNLGAIANSSALGTLDLKITRRQNEGKSYFDLTDLQGSISLVSIITAKFNFTHTSCGAAVDLSVVDSNIGRVNANLGMSAVALAA